MAQSALTRFLGAAQWTVTSWRFGGGGDASDPDMANSGVLLLSARLLGGALSPRFLISDISAVKGCSCPSMDLVSRAELAEKEPPCYSAACLFPCSALQVTGHVSLNAELSVLLVGVEGPGTV